MKTLQEQAEAMLETIDASNGKKHSRLTPNDRALIFNLAAKGNLTYEEIGKAVGCDKSTVCRVLQMVDTRQAARVILESGAAKMADTVVNTKDAGTALKALGKLDVVREDSRGAGNNVLVVVPPIGGARAGSNAGYEHIDGRPVSESEMEGAGTVIVIGQPGRPACDPFNGVVVSPPEIVAPSDPDAV